MKFWIVKNAWWMRWADGMVLWPWVWLRLRKVNENPKTAYHKQEAKQDREWNARIFRHELEHVYQIAKVGRFRFYYRYLANAIKHTYRNIPSEVEAYAHQDEALTAKEKRWLVNGKIEVET